MELNAAEHVHGMSHDCANDIYGNFTRWKIPIVAIAQSYSVRGANR